jgi:hypothetical protein
MGRDFSLIFFRRKVTVSFALNSFIGAQLILFIYLLLLLRLVLHVYKRHEGGSHNSFSFLQFSLYSSIFMT